MSLGWGAAALASHLAMVMAALLLAHVITGLQGLPGIASQLWSAPRVQWGCWAVGTAFVIERSYYAVARYAITYGVDFWASHPVPEALALMLTGAFLWLAWAVARTAGCRRGLRAGSTVIALTWTTITVAGW